jgi:hypothetical protein
MAMMGRLPVGSAALRALNVGGVKQRLGRFIWPDQKTKS